MITAQQTSMWRGRYQISADGQPVTVWDPSWWRGGGDLEIEGRRFQVRANGWATKYRMLDEAGNEIALVEGAGRKHWSVRSGAGVYEFRRASMWTSTNDMIVNGEAVGWVRRKSAWSGQIEADLPGMPLWLQIFVVGVQIALWQTQQAAAAAAS